MKKMLSSLLCLLLVVAFSCPAAARAPMHLPAPETKTAEPAAPADSTAAAVPAPTAAALTPAEYDAQLNAILLKFASEADSMAKTMDAAQADPTKALKTALSIIDQLDKIVADISALKEPAAYAALDPLFQSASTKTTAAVKLFHTAVNTLDMTKIQQAQTALVDAMSSLDAAGAKYDELYAALE